MSAILAGPPVRIAVLATIGQPHSTKLAKFTEPARLKAAEGGVAGGMGPADVHQGPPASRRAVDVSADGKTAGYKDDAVELLRSLPEGARLKIGAMPIMSDTAIFANPHDQVDKDREIAPYSRVHPGDGRRGKTSFLHSHITEIFFSINYPLFLYRRIEPKRLGLSCGLPHSETYSRTGHVA